MDEKTIAVLEFAKIRARLARYASFSASEKLALSLQPSSNEDDVRLWQAQTREARHLILVNDSITLGGARDIREAVDLAAHGGVVDASAMLEVKNTLIAARNLLRSFNKNENEYPALAQITERLTPPGGIIEAISRALSERGEVLDTASDKLGNIRRNLTVTHGRLMGKLQRMISDPRHAPMLQEAIITQRNGRYVIPIKAEYKAKLRSIVHDQSQSGATFFVEPLGVVEMNNEWRELQLAEQDEERRILAELSALVGSHAPQLEGIVGALAEFDLKLMMAKYAEDLRAVEPVLEKHKTRADHPGNTLVLYEARHPLLDADKVIASDILMDGQTFAIVITGPNTGGKTVTLKTAGLLVLMAQSGLQIPVQSGSRLSLYQNVFADIGDEQSIEQSLSTFSGHVTNIARILKLADSNSLVLFDELGAGTDPQEGAALARAMLDYLVKNQIPCLVATHYPELKTYAHTTPGVINASMEFDLKTLRPTFHLMIGLPGRSNALLIAERLGLPDGILEAARSEIHPDELKADALLDEIHRQRDLARQTRQEAEVARRKAEALQAELVQKLEAIEEERLNQLQTAKDQSLQEVESLQAEMKEMRKALSKAGLPLEAVKALQADLDAVQDEVEKPIRRKPTPSKRSGELQIGEKVRLRNLNLLGKVTQITKDGVEVQAGPLRARARMEDVERLSVVEDTASPPVSSGGPRTASMVQLHSSPGMEVDLRGMRAEDALEKVNDHIEAAYLANQPFVRIIHGKGTGRLRQVIQEALRQSSYVKKQEVGSDKEGGEGVTIAFMKD